MEENQSLVHKAQTIPTGSLARHFAQEAKALVVVMPPSRIVRELAATTSRTDRAFVLSLVPSEKMSAVLFTDKEVFAPSIRERRGKTPYGIIPITPEEYREMQRRVKKNPHLTADLEAHLVVLQCDAVGNPISVCLRQFAEDMNSDEALERLDAILESGNDDAWKRAALEAVPVEYWIFALKDGGEHADELHAKINEMKRLLGVEEIHFAWGETDLYLRVMEAREERLPEFAETVEVGEDTAAAETAMSEKPARGQTARDLLAEIRGTK